MDGFTSLITNTEDFVEFLKEYKWQKGKEFINSPIINFLESKFIAKRPEEVDIEIDQWRIFFPQLIESEDNEKYPFAGIDLDVFQKKKRSRFKSQKLFTNKWW